MKITMKYPGGLSKALTLSYDDGVTADIRMIEIMKQYGIKGTFNINTGLFAPADTSDDPRTSRRRMTEKELIETFADSGMEPAVHGYKHLHLTDISYDEAYDDVYVDRVNLEALFSRPIRGMAYPWGPWSDMTIEVLSKAGILYSRTTNATHTFGFPENWLALHPTCHHNDGRLFELADEFISAEPDEPIMFYLWGHTYEFDTDNNWERIIEFFEKIGRRDDIWYATNMEIYEYIKAFESLDFSAEKKSVYNPSAIDICFTADGRDYCVKSGEILVL